MTNFGIEGSNQSCRNWLTCRQRGDIPLERYINRSAATRTASAIRQGYVTPFCERSTPSLLFQIEPSTLVRAFASPHHVYEPDELPFGLHRTRISRPYVAGSDPPMHKCNFGPTGQRVRLLAQLSQLWPNARSRNPALFLPVLFGFQYMKNHEPTNPKVVPIALVAIVFGGNHRWRSYDQELRLGTICVCLERESVVLMNNQKSKPPYLACFLAPTIKKKTKKEKISLQCLSIDQAIMPGLLPRLRNDAGSLHAWQITVLLHKDDRAPERGLPKFPITLKGHSLTLAVVRGCGIADLPPLGTVPIQPLKTFLI